MLIAILIWASFGLVCKLFTDHLDQIVISHSSGFVSPGFFTTILERLLETIINIIIGPIIFLIQFVAFKSKNELTKLTIKETVYGIIDDIKKFRNVVVNNYEREVLEDKLELALRRFPRFW